MKKNNFIFNKIIRKYSTYISKFYLSVGLSEVEADDAVVDLEALGVLGAPVTLATFETITTTNFFESILQSLILVSSLSIFPV